MKKLLSAVVLAGAMMLLPAAPASAANFIGEFCWIMSPFEEIVRLSISQGGKMFEMHGSWGKSGGYEMAATGSAFVRWDGQIEFGLGIANDYSLVGFANSSWIALHAVLSPSTLSGPYRVKGAKEDFTYTGTLTSCLCP